MRRYEPGGSFGACARTIAAAGPNLIAFGDPAADGTWGGEVYVAPIGG